ncbi:MAG: SdrD B-like domain-containing protein [archaeon]
MKSRYLCAMLMMLWVIVLSGNIPAQAQCDLSGFITYSQAGWSSDANGNNIGTLRDIYFPKLFPNGLSIGGSYTIKLTGPSSLVRYLKGGGGAPDRLSHNYTDPDFTESGLFGVNVVSLMLNVYFDEAIKAGAGSFLLKNLFIASGAFQGKTVWEFLVIANKTIGGENTGFYCADLNEIASKINENFEEGKQHKGYLSCTPPPPSPVSIGDKVWLDSNKNGIQDQGESGIANVTVQLYNCDNTMAGNTVTDANGKYSFTNLGTCSYYLKVVIPKEYTMSPQHQGTNDALDSDFDPDGKTKCYTPAGCKCDYDVSLDAGMYPTAAQTGKLGDLVWNDLNGNGIQDTGEPGLQGITVELHNCLGTYYSSRITDSKGFYTFINIPPGSYYIKVITTGYSVSPMNQGTNDALDSDLGADGRTACVDITAGSYVTTLDAGLMQVQTVNTDLQVTMSVSKSNLQCDENFYYTVTVKNNGPAAASGVVITDILPLGTDFISSAASQGTYTSTDGKWAAGSLAVGASATLTLNVKVNCNELSTGAWDLGPAKGYNVFVFENLTQPSADAQGRVAVGGDAYFANYSVGDLLPPNSGNVLVVGHNLTFVSGAVNNGNVVYGGTTNLPQPAVSISGGTLIHATPVDFNAARTYLQNLSVTLSKYAATGTALMQWGTLTLTGTDPHLNVFAVSGTDLSAANNVVINAPNGSVVLVNISGQNVSWMGGLTVYGTAISNVIYNFYQAQTLKIQGIDIRGTVLAPMAALDFPAGLITGQVIVKCMTGSGQFNLNPFIGNIPAAMSFTNTAVLTASVPVDIILNNNSASITVNVNTPGGGGGNGGGGTPWPPVWSFGEMIYAFAFDGCNMYAAVWGGKIYKSTDSGKTWVLISDGMDAVYIWALTVLDGRLFAATVKGIYMYNGTKWTLIGCANMDVHDLVSYNGVLYAVTWAHGVYMSNNYGVNWTPVNNGFKVMPVIQAITVAANGDLYIATFGSGIYKLAYGTSTWIQLGCQYQMFWAIAAYKTTIFAASYGDGLYKSTDGITWTRITSLPVQFVYAIEIAPCGSIYITSLSGGIYMSEDNGLTWKHLDFNAGNLCALIVDPSTENVFVGTKSGDLYRISGSLSGGETELTKPVEYGLKQNYPNPFNPSTTIEFSVSNAGHYTLTVYDMLGREVAVLLNSELAAGYHKAVFDAGKVPSGVYMYRLSGNNLQMMKKMILIK